MKEGKTKLQKIVLVQRNLRGGVQQKRGRRDLKAKERGESNLSGPEGTDAGVTNLVIQESMERRDLWRRTSQRWRTGRRLGTPTSLIPTSNADPRPSKVPFGRLFSVESGTRGLDCMENLALLIKNPPNNKATPSPKPPLLLGGGGGSRASDCFVLDLYDAPLTSIARASVDAGRAGGRHRRG